MNIQDRIVKTIIVIKEAGQGLTREQIQSILLGNETEELQALELLEVNLYLPLVHLHQVLEVMVQLVHQSFLQLLQLDQHFLRFVSQKCHQILIQYMYNFPLFF